MDSIVRKGSILREIHIEQADYGVKFPNEYIDEDENVLIQNFMNLFIASQGESTELGPGPGHGPAPTGLGEFGAFLR